MSDLLIVEPMLLQAATSRGSGAANLSTRDPKEVWADSAAGSPATITVDLGSARSIDTISLVAVTAPAIGATWAITGGIAGAGEIVIQAAAELRVPDVADTRPPLSHALWHGAARTVRYLAITVIQPAGQSALTIGRLIVGKAFVPGLGREWGFGRAVIDTGTATELPSGGFAVVDGVRKLSLSWTFGDLSIEETDRLEMIGLELGQTSPALVIEDADRTPGLRSRMHYGLFSWRAWERRNRKQTRWEISVRQWV